MGRFVEIFQDKIRRFADQALSDLKECGKSATTELIHELSSDLQDLYSSKDAESPGAAEKWYNAYTPRFYKRNFSLYEIMEVESDADASRISIGFNGSKLTKDRKGDSLFEKVFINGWHGGAYDTQTGWIRYRTPYLNYSQWGRQAFQSTSPLSLFRESKRKFEIDAKARIRSLTIQKFKEKYH